MAGALENLAKLTLHTFHRGVQSADFARCLANLKDHLKTITLNDIPLKRDILYDKETYNPLHHEAPVGYFPIAEVDDVYSMGVFIVRPGCRLPLHDHPYMTGLIKVVHGSMQVDMYSKCAEPIPEELSTVLRPWQQVIAVQKDASQMVGAQDDICVLTPTQSNFHEIRSVDGPAAFLDILAPPYHEEGGPRTCKYYKVLDHPSHGVSNIKFLLEVMQPMDFHCELVPPVEGTFDVSPGPENEIVSKKD